MKTIQEIYEQESIRLIEDAIFEACREHERMKFADPYGKNVTHLLKIRKELLDREFVMDEQYKGLLSEFNEAMKTQVIDMRTKVIATYQAIASTEVMKGAEVKGKCLLGLPYPTAHPIQTERAKKMWKVLNGSIDDYMPIYKDWGFLEWEYSGGAPPSENQLLYLGDEVDNWNEYLDRDMTDDMHLIHPFHFLYECNSFSLFDLLWVRDFDTEISINKSFSTYED